MTSPAERARNLLEDTLHLDSGVALDRVTEVVQTLLTLADELAEPVFRPAILLPPYEMGVAAGEDKERRIIYRLIYRLIIDTLEEES